MLYAMSFEEIRKQPRQGKFISDVFQSGADCRVFKWKTTVWNTWPQFRVKFWEMWDQEGHINHPKRSFRAGTREEQEAIRLVTLARAELVVPIDNRDPIRARTVIPLL